MKTLNRIFLMLGLCLFSSTIFANSFLNNGNSGHTSTIYPGGLDAFYTFLSNNLDYPIEARELHIEGTVWVELVIEKDGTVSQIEALTNHGGGLEDEALRVLGQIQQWEPLKDKNRRKVKIPVVFDLEM